MLDSTGLMFRRPPSTSAKSPIRSRTAHWRPQERVLGESLNRRRTRLNGEFAGVFVAVMDAETTAHRNDQKVKLPPTGVRARSRLVARARCRRCGYTSRKFEDAVDRNAEQERNHDRESNPHSVHFETLPDGY
jgi:hypothetical protein